ncbi:MAG: hypothetical protein AB8H80_04145 [Planctomycetota bacterium]
MDNRHDETPAPARRGGNLGTFDPSRRQNAEPNEQTVGAHRGSPLGYAPSPSPNRWRYLLGGLVAAWLFGFILPRNFTWFLSAIPHEMGHATFGCLLGHPSSPNISLSGHAWTGIGVLRPWLAWTIAAAFGLFAIGMVRRPLTCAALAATAVLIPLCAFTGVSQILIAVGGHVGELAFATWCFTLAWTGGQTDSAQERVGSAMAGALVQFVNLKLCFGLLTSAAARNHYAGNGSLGLKNDYLILAEDLLGWRLGSVAMVMFIAALLPLPLGVLLGMWRQRVAD